MKKVLVTFFCIQACLIFIYVNDIFDIGILRKSRNESRTHCVVNTLVDTLVVVNFNYPVYDTMEILQELYNGVFGRIISCGAVPRNNSHMKPELIVPAQPVWFFRYHQCFALGMKKHPHFKGK